MILTKKAPCWEPSGRQERKLESHEEGRASACARRRDSGYKSRMSKSAGTGDGTREGDLGASAHGDRGFSAKTLTVACKHMYQRQSFPWPGCG